MKVRMFYIYIFTLSLLYTYIVPVSAQSVENVVTNSVIDSVTNSVTNIVTKNNCIYAGNEAYVYEGIDRQKIYLPAATSSNLVLGCLNIVLDRQGKSSLEAMRFTLTDEAMLNSAPCPVIRSYAMVPTGKSNKHPEVSGAFYDYEDIYKRKVIQVLPRNNQILNQCYYYYEISDSNYFYSEVYIAFDTYNWNVFKKSQNYSQKLDIGYIQNVACCNTITLYKVRNDNYQMPMIETGSYDNNIYTKYWELEDFNLNKSSSSTDSASSILFFPGMLGSQLYDVNVYSYPPKLNKVWPSILSSTQAKMTIYNADQMYIPNSTPSGMPHVMVTEKDTHTEYDNGVTKTIGTLDVYDTFINSIKKLKNDNIISDFAAIPYDFRLATSDIYCNGVDDSGSYDYIYYDTRYDRSNVSGYNKCQFSYVRDVLKRLINSSKTGRVTLIGHSYGGLVIKEMLKALEDNNDPLLAHIDKAILIAVPQAGSPESVIGLLHGVELGTKGIVMTAGTERDLAVTFPSMYQLLPNDSLIKSLSSSGHPILSFKNKNNDVATNSPSDYSKSIIKYGDTIDNADELYSYILAKDNRLSATSTADLYRASKGIDALMTHAIAEKAKLDNYVPTSTIQVYQIAGWGIPTLINYDYDYTVGCLAYSLTQSATSTISLIGSSNYKCIQKGATPKHIPTMYKNGDDTVPVPSALYMDTASHPNVKNYWVDLEGYNKGKILNRKHKDIFSVLPVLNKILNLIKNNYTQVDFIKDSAPTSTNQYITYSLHSPVHMTITDTLGNVSGYSSSTDNIVDNIPEVYYKIYGDTQTVTIPSTLAHTIDLGGYTDGVYTLDIYKSNSNDQVLSTTTFYSIPTTAHSMARMAYSTTTATTTSTLYLDLNGNKNIDNIITSTTTSTYTASSTLPTDDRPLSSISPLPVCTTTYTTVTIAIPAIKKNGILIPAVKINKQVPIIKCK